MIKITVAAVGKIKEDYFLKAAAEYEKRLSRYCDLTVTEIQPDPLPQNPTAAQVEAALLHEAGRIEKACKSQKTVALCIEGDALSSEEFALLMNEAERTGTPLSFVIGGSHGIHKSVKNKAYKKISFSKMTFPHRLFRVMLLEQIYRAFKINEGGAYHK